MRLAFLYIMTNGGVAPLGMFPVIDNRCNTTFFGTRIALWLASCYRNFSSLP